MPEELGETRKTSPIQRVIRASDLLIEIHFLGIDQVDDVQRVMGMNVSAVLIDEGREISDLKGVLGQLLTRTGRYPPKREGGLGFTTRAMVISNASDRFHDLYKLCVTETPSGTEAFLAPPGLLEDRKTTNPEAENVNNLPKGYYELLARNLPPDRLAVEVMNEWETMQEGKPVVPEFRSTTHVSREKLHPKARMPLLVGLDPGNHPAAVIAGCITTERGEVRWEIYEEVIGSNITTTRFAGVLKDVMERKYPEHTVELAWVDPVAYQPTDRDDDRLIAEVYEAITGWKLKAPQSNLVGVQLEAMRQPFNALVDGQPAIMIDPDCHTLIEALAGKVCFKTAIANREEVTTDMIIKRHPYHDVLMAACYLMLGGGGYTAMRDLIKRAKKDKRGNAYYDPRSGLWRNRDTGAITTAPGSNSQARDVDYKVLG